MRILIAVASKHGGTSGIAERVGRVMTDRGHDVSMRPAAEVRDIDDPSADDLDDDALVDRPDAVLIGSGVYAGHWLPEAVELVDRCWASLQRRPVWLFSSGPIGDPSKPEPSASVDVGSILERTAARGHEVFGGRLQRHDLGLLDRAVVTALRAPEGDFRDWSHVDRWAGAVADELGSVSAASGAGAR